MLPLLMTALAIGGEWFVAAGGQFDADSHGITTVGFRDGPWSAALYTDTLDVRVAPELQRGRAWASLRVEAGAAGLFLSPWEDGARAPEQALYAGYIGADGGLVRYLPRGFWVGAELQTRAWWFLPTPTTTVDVLGWTNIATVRGLGGWWTSPASLDVHLGMDLRDDRISPHLAARWRWTPDWRLRPVVTGQAGWAEGQDAITFTRLGGINPYVIPLAGAAWAEFRVEDFVALQAGPSLNLETWSLDLLVHAAHFTRCTELGLGPRILWQPGLLGVEVSAGYSPTLERQLGAAVSGYVLFTWSSPS